MGFNLNTSRKPEYKLNESLIHENIQMYGFPVLFLYSDRVNEDSIVFRDFSHYKITPGVSKQIYILPEDSSNWGGDAVFNSFGFYDMHNTVGYVSKKTMLELFPGFLETEGVDSKIINSLIVTPDSTILEITDINRYDPGVNNLWAFADQGSSYKLTMKIYDINISDEGVSEIAENVKLEETEIFEHDEPIDTSTIDDFFNDVQKIKVKTDIEGAKKSKSGGPFGNLS
jgi:hypothetical protein